MNLLFVVSFILCFSFSFATINKKISRNIDISSQLVKIESSIILSEDAASTYMFAVEEENADFVSFVGAVTKTGDDGIGLPTKETPQPGKKGKFFEIGLTLKDGSSAKELVVTAILVHKLVPFPSEITQAEKQYVKYSGNAMFYSQYKTLSEDTTIQLSSNNVLEYTTGVKPSNKQDKVISYGPFKDVAPFTVKPIIVHYENNNPFLTVVDMTRWIEISHWGNIAIEESIHMVHSGAKLKGSFSRYDYQRNQDGVSSVKSFKTILPAAAKDVYYRDEIGNISTSHMRDLSDSVELELRPRFPLFGGWQTRYVLGYNIPSYEYLFYSGNTFAIRFPFIDHIHDDMVVDRVTVKIVFPEGANVYEYILPYLVIIGARENIKTYLDTTGRTVFVMSKANLVENHIENVIIKYKFSMFSMIREPLMVAIFFYILCMTVIVAVRLDFSISKDEQSESRQRVRALLELIVATQDKRSALYQSYEDAINKYKQHKDSNKLSNDTNNIDATHRQLTKQISEVIQKLRGEHTSNPDIIERLLELQQQDAKLHELANGSMQQAEKLITGKIKREQYIETESKTKEKRKEIIVRMDALIEAAL